MSSDLIRWGGLAAILAGVAFILDILFHFAMPEADWTNVAVYTVALVLMVVGLLRLHALQKDSYGRIGRVGFWTVVVVTLAQVLGLAVLLLGSDVLFWLGLVGFIAVPVGLILYGVATLQARVLPRWCGLGLIIIPPITIIPRAITTVYQNYGLILLGLLWLALGYVLWSGRGTAAERASRVT